MAGDKRGYASVGEKTELGSKRPKMRDLDSVLRTEESKEKAATKSLDLNAGKSTSIKETKGTPSSGRQEKVHNVDSVKSKGFVLDLNAEDVSSSKNHNKNDEYSKSRDESECSSSVGPLEEKDPMKVWKEMKQNGFLSSSLGGVPVHVPVPKPRARKTKNDVIKKKMEIAKREQVDRFAKIAAPSGLLNGLNPGIINHVRNSKQVHSIIEAIVKSEKLENGKTKEKLEVENVNRSVSINLERTERDLEPPYTFGNMNYPPQFNSNFEDDLALKLSSSTRIASENASSLSNEESTMTSLSINAANVASQWLELLNQDVKGRLAALRRSKKRVRAVINTELPYLESREFSLSQENDPCMGKTSNNVTSDAHRTRWGSLFGQMEKTLNEEERQLEIWLNQIKDMQVHCEKGLENYKGNNGLPMMEKIEKVDNLERDSAVRAAAASIYSTCNYISSMENQPCC